MSKGKGHDRFNLFFGMVSAGVLLGFSTDWILSIFFLVGWLFSTLLFSPDTDVAPKKRSGLLQFILYPYSILFKHRGVSHHIILGTFTRVLYGVILFGLLVYVFHKMGHISINLKSYSKFLYEFIMGFNYKIPIYKYLVWFYLGMFLSDLCHILLDRVTSFFKRLWRKVL